MNCPKCGHQNHDHARACFYCRTSLLEPEPLGEPVDIRTSRLAVASAILAVLSIPGFIMFSGSAVQRFDSYEVHIPAFVCCLSGVAAVFLGLIALACIEINYGRLTGRAYAAIGIAIPLFGVFLINVYASLARTRSVAYRLTCTTNLSGIGKAMLIYANDYDDELPRAGGRNSALGTTPNWQGDTRRAAFGFDSKGNGGQASMSANFYLLVKYAEVTPKSFRCDKDRAFKEFKLRDYKIANKDIIDLWDFGPDPAKHVSFSYHIPYGNYALTSSNLPGMAVAADRNPWLPSPAGYRSKTDFQAFDPNGTRKIIKRANALHHKGDGQNVLFVDCHVSFEREPFCGVKDDNIYTPQTTTDIRKGTLPTLTSQPASRTDSLLLHDPPKGAGK
ncbi:MAG: hypothetical protein ISS79_05065 [Phycisphaerae bacterium]|nr:hypothetical protein [Phycisphaerae bacterium]